MPHQLPYVNKQVSSSVEPDGILGCPPPDAHVAVPRPEPHEPGVRVVEPARESKRDALWRRNARVDPGRSQNSHLTDYSFGHMLLGGDGGRKELEPET